MRGQATPIRHDRQRRAPKNTPTTIMPQGQDFPPTSRPSSTSGRLDHPWLLRDWARTSRNDLSTAQNTWKLPDISSLHNVSRTGIRLTIETMQTYFFSKDIQPTLWHSNEARLRKAKGRRRSSGAPVPKMVELSGIEPLTPCLQSRCSPS